LVEKDREASVACCVRTQREKRKNDEEEEECFSLLLQESGHDGAQLFETVRPASLKARDEDLDGGTGRGGKDYHSL